MNTIKRQVEFQVADKTDAMKMVRACFERCGEKPPSGRLLMQLSGDLYRAAEKSNRLIENIIAQIS